MIRKKIVLLKKKNFIYSPHPWKYREPKLVNWVICDMPSILLSERVLHLFLIELQQQIGNCLYKVN